MYSIIKFGIKWVSPYLFLKIQEHTKNPLKTFRAKIPTKSNKSKTQKERDLKKNLKKPIFFDFFSFQFQHEKPKHVFHIRIVFISPPEPIKEQYDDAREFRKHSAKSYFALHGSTETSSNKSRSIAKSFTINQRTDDRSFISIYRPRTKRMTPESKQSRVKVGPAIKRWPNSSSDLYKSAVNHAGLSTDYFFQFLPRLWAAENCGSRISFCRSERLIHDIVIGVWKLRARTFAFVDFAIVILKYMASLWIIAIA